MELLALGIGVVLASFGGERFVRGCVGASVALRIPAGAIGATVAAFATSSPELVVAVIAASGGESGLALGDATGSSVVNLGVVLGLALVAVPITVGWPELRRQLPAVLGATVLVGVLAADGTVSRLDAALLLSLFVTWLLWVGLAARRSRDVTAEVIGDGTVATSLVDLGLGAVLLVVAGRLVLVGAKWIGQLLGWDDFLTGAVLVAFATSTPELATMFVSMRRGRPEVGVGALLGSNVFNLAFVVGTAAAISPIQVRWAEVSVALAFGAGAALLVIPPARGVLGRRRGATLLVGYAIYVVVLLFVV